MNHNNMSFIRYPQAENYTFNRRQRRAMMSLIKQFVRRTSRKLVVLYPDIIWTDEVWLGAIQELTKKFAPHAEAIVAGKEQRGEMKITYGERV